MMIVEVTLSMLTINIFGRLLAKKKLSWKASHSSSYNSGDNKFLFVPRIRPESSSLVIAEWWKELLLICIIRGRLRIVVSYSSPNYDWVIFFIGLAAFIYIIVQFSVPSIHSER